MFVKNDILKMLDILQVLNEFSLNIVEKAIEVGHALCCMLKLVY